MSTISIPDSSSQSSYSPGANGAPGGTSTPTPEMIEKQVARAKDIIAGRITVPPMVTPPSVEAFMKRQYGAMNPPPTPEVVRRFTEQLSLDALYRGAMVVCFRTADGHLAVLASGEEEIHPVLRGLSREEVSKVIVMDTEPS